MNFKYLQAFVEVANTASFSIAAERMYTVQSAMSRHIRALEKEVGVRLFERSTRRVMLTPAGEVFLRHVQAILQHCEQAKHHAQNVASGKTGILNIGYMSSACAHFLPGLLRRFYQFAADVEVNLYDMTAQQQLEAFSEGTIDIGFSRPVERGFELRLQRLHLLNDAIYLVVSDWHPLASAPQVSLHDLENYQLTLFSRAHAPQLFDVLINAFHQYGMQKFAASEPASMQALLTQVASSRNVALVPGCVRQLQTQGCMFIPLKEPLEVALEMHWKPTPTAIVNTWLRWFEEHRQGIASAV